MRHPCASTKQPPKTANRSTFGPASATTARATRRSPSRSGTNICRGDRQSGTRSRPPGPGPGPGPGPAAGRVEGPAAHGSSLYVSIVGQRPTGCRVYACCPVRMWLANLRKGGRRRGRVWLNSCASTKKPPKTANRSNSSACRSTSCRGQRRRRPDGAHRGRGAGNQAPRRRRRNARTGETVRDDGVLPHRWPRRRSPPNGRYRVSRWQTRRLVAASG